MKRQAQHPKDAEAESLQNRLLFWLAAALAPESAPWYVGYTPSLFRYAELVRQPADAIPVEDPANAEAPVEDERRAA
jgi:hypothetical protein